MKLSPQGWLADALVLLAALIWGVAFYFQKTAMLHLGPFLFLGLRATIAAVALAPFAVLGAVLGVRLHHLVPEKAFFTLTYVLLVLTGTKLIWDALT